MQPAFVASQAAVEILVKSIPFAPRASHFFRLFFINRMKPYRRFFPYMQNRPNPHGDTYILLKLFSIIFAVAIACALLLNDMISSGDLPALTINPHRVHRFLLPVLTIAALLQYGHLIFFASSSSCRIRFHTFHHKP
jgi:hypothetical protein